MTDCIAAFEHAATVYAGRTPTWASLISGHAAQLSDADLAESLDSIPDPRKA